MTAHARAARVVAVVAAGLLLAGCSTIRGGAYDLPLPGGADVGERPMTIEAEFDDVLDLVPHSSVKLDDVDVGEVTDIELADGGRAALVTMEVRSDLDLTTDTSARVQQTSLLGEKFIALTPGVGSTPLEDGAELGLPVTSQAVDAEEVLGALSMLLTGGGVGQFQTITREINDIGRGRTPEVRAFLEDVDSFVTALNAKRPSISQAIDRLAELSSTLSGNRAAIDDVLDRLAPGLQEVADQRDDLVEMLAALDDLSEVTVRILDAAADDTVVTLRQLNPVLSNLARSGRDLPRSLQVLPTFPFTDAVLDAVKGDYFNAFITMSIVQQATAQPRGAFPYTGQITPPPMMLSSFGLEAPETETPEEPSDGPSESDGPTDAPTTDGPTTDGPTDAPSTTDPSDGSSSTPGDGASTASPSTTEETTP